MIVVLLITLLLLGLGMIMAYREYYRDMRQNTLDLPPPTTTHTRARVLRSPRLWHDIRAHRLAVALFGVYWLIVILITVPVAALYYHGMPSILLVPHLIVAIAAAALVAWWRDADEKAVPVCLGVGALISAVEVWVIEFAGDLACWLANSCIAPPTDEEPAWVFLLVLSIYTSVIGLVLGLLGWLVAVTLMPIARWLRGRDGPAAPTAVA